MTTFVAQSYPLWFAECMEGHDATEASRVVAWRLNEHSGALHPVVVPSGNQHVPFVVEAFDAPVGAFFGYGETPEQARQVAYRAALAAAKWAKEATR